MSEKRKSSLLGKITVFFVICCLVIGSFVVNTAAALDGSGSQQDPWRIKSLEDFNDFAADANYWDDYTRLQTDVNLAGMVYERAVIASDVNMLIVGFQGTAFSGIFDGNNHKIINLNINDSGAGNDLGLFGYIGDGEVRNLGLEGSSVSGDDDDYVSGLVGVNYGSISNCYSIGDVNGPGVVGGLVGLNGGYISNCYSTGSVSSKGGVGGLVGWNYGGSVSDCSSSSVVSGVYILGGLVGENWGNVVDCYSTGDVNGVDRVGGLVGSNGYGFTGNISNCYSTGDVHGNEFVGGLVGLNFNASISNCYSTGDVNGVWPVGGVVGYNDSHSFAIAKCFWDTDTQTHGITESIGDNQGTSTNVVGLPTTQMQTRSTFTDVDWDFINVWNIGENQTYPYLRTYLAGDINKDQIVNFLDFVFTANQWLQDQ